ncbi:MAG: VOC family protein [Akkermansia muciniphila]
MIQQIDHIGIAVKSLDATVPYYRDALGLGEPHIEEVPTQKVRVAMFDVAESTSNCSTTSPKRYRQGY